jgi:hypothetical protein
MNHFDDKNIELGHQNPEIYASLNTETLDTIKKIIDTHLPFDKLISYTEQDIIVRQGEIAWNDTDYSGLLTVNYRSDSLGQDSYITIATQPLYDTKNRHIEPHIMEMYYLDLSRGILMVGSEYIDDSKPNETDYQTQIEQAELMAHAGAAKPTIQDLEKFLTLLDTMDELMVNNERRKKKFVSLLTNFFSRS